jgi:aryl-alcohol dehydrogenase-like predicted oxidoreductase
VIEVAAAIDCIGLVDEAQHKDVGLRLLDPDQAKKIVWTFLETAFGGGRHGRRVEKIEAVCRRHGVKLADAALRFALAHPVVASVVLGAVTPAEIAAQQASLAAAIPRALWADLVAQGLLDANLPVPT